MNEYDDIPKLLRARADRRGLSVIDYTADCGLDRVAADEIERLRAALREYVATVVDAEGVAFIDRMPTAELRLLVESAFRQEKPFEDRWDNA